MTSGFARRPLPEIGAWRVHPAPGALPRLTGEGPGPNRYDDPRGLYAVRYGAENLTGALVETMARFRPSPDAESLLANVSGIDEDDLEHADPTTGIRDWLARQQVGRIVLDDPSGELVDVHDPLLLASLDKHPQVRDALDLSGLGTLLNPVRLDEGIVRLGGPVGRPITQAVSAAIRDWHPQLAGLAYRSRIDDDEWCWAMWDATPVRITAEPLTAQHRHHRRAVQHAARILEIVLPINWL